MAFFDYGAAAELFPSRQRTMTMGAVTYMRFAAAAEAIRYAVEEIPANSFRGAFLEVNEERFDSNEIRRLYECVEYPLPRQHQHARQMSTIRALVRYQSGEPEQWSRKHCATRTPRQL
jgi:hypothetical protein